MLEIKQELKDLMNGIVYRHLKSKTSFNEISTYSFDYSKWPEGEARASLETFYKNTGRGFEYAQTMTSEAHRDYLMTINDRNLPKALELTKDRLEEQVKLYWQDRFAFEVGLNPGRLDALIGEYHSKKPSGVKLYKLNEEIGNLTRRQLERIKSGDALVKIPAFPILSEYIGGFNPSCVTILTAPSGFGKCLGRGTKVLMYDGTLKCVEDVVVGDRLMGPDSQARTVLTLGHGSSLMYRVTLINGDSFVCNDDHILSLYETGKENGYCEYSVKDFLKLPKSRIAAMKCWKAPVEFKKNKLDIDPYFAGLWIGDGTFVKPEITTPDPEIKEYVINYANSMGLVVRAYPGHGCEQLNITKGNGSGGKRSPLQNLLEQFRVNGEKRIPHKFLTSNKRDRLSLLAGIIDTDGYTFRTSVEISTKYKGLAEDISFLARSLGLRTAITNKVVKGKCYYLISVNGDTHEIPCLVRRKKPAVRTQVKKSNRYGFSVECIGYGDYFGFEIDSDGLFLLGDFTVTHNTNLSVSLAQSASEIMPVLYFNMEMDYDNFAARFLHNGAEISNEDWRTGSFIGNPNSESKILKFAEDRQAKHEIVFTDGKALTVAEIKATAYSMFDGNSKGLVIVDYDQKIILDRSKDEWRELLYAISEFEEIAKRTRTHWIILCQGDDEGEIKASKRMRQVATNMLTFGKEKNGISPLIDKYYIKGLKTRYSGDKVVEVGVDLAKSKVYEVGLLEIKAAPSKGKYAF